MSRYTVLARSFAAVAAIAAATTATTALTAPVAAKPPSSGECAPRGPVVYCTSDGQYYLNACWAAKAGATGCTTILYPP